MNINNRIVNDDCLKFMKTLPDNAVSISITSPPYNLGEVIKRKNGNRFDIGYNDKRSYSEYFNLLDSSIFEMIRVSKNWVFFNIQPLVNNIKPLCNIIGKYEKNIKEIIIWHKTTPPPSISSSTLSGNYEFIVVFTKEENAKTRGFKGLDFGRQGKMTTCWNGIPNSNYSKDYFSAKGHGTVMPLWLPIKIINNFTKKNDIVLDPFFGYGTTGLASIMLERQFLGIEIDKEYCNIAEKRISIWRNQKKIVNWW